MSPRRDSQGGRANSSGSTLEQTVKGALQSKGFKFVQYGEWVKNPEKYGRELVLKHVPYETIYKKGGRTEFLIKSERYQKEIRIECKWQESEGSVDNKFPYVYLNCIERYPEQDIIIVVEGGGASPESIKWLKGAIEAKKYTDEISRLKNIQVMNLAEFVRWANRTFR